VQTSELKFFKTMLEERKIQLLKNINAVHKEIVELNSCELNDTADHSCTSDHIRLGNALSSRQEQELHQIQSALGKIALGSTGTYGACEMCDDEIGFARLKVKPHALYCIHCREDVEKSDSRRKTTSSFQSKERSF